MSLAKSPSCIILAVFFFFACSKDNAVNPKTKKETPGYYKALQASTAPTVDGIASETDWDLAVWAPINQLWLGAAYTAEDFQGRFKALWSPDKLYLLVEIVDDYLMDTHTNPLVSYWDDDCLEVFLDENKSGGDHQNNYNAFAYHVALDYNVADIGIDGQAHLYSDLLQVRRVTSGTTSIWEFAIPIYNDLFVYGATDNPTVQLSQGKKMGFMLAYCDADLSRQREDFIGSIMIQGTDKNVGWMNASVFGTMELVK
jgi:hypothetical protein